MNSRLFPNFEVVESYIELEEKDKYKETILSEKFIHEGCEIKIQARFPGHYQDVIFSPYFSYARTIFLIGETIEGTTVPKIDYDIECKNLLTYVSLFRKIDFSKFKESCENLEKMFIGWDDNFALPEFTCGLLENTEIREGIFKWRWESPEYLYASKVLRGIMSFEEAQEYEILESSSYIGCLKTFIELFDLLNDEQVLSKIQVRLDAEKAKLKQKRDQILNLDYFKIYFMDGKNVNHLTKDELIYFIENKPGITYSFQMGYSFRGATPRQVSKQEMLEIVRKCYYDVEFRDGNLFVNNYSENDLY